MVEMKSFRYLMGVHFLFFYGNIPKVTVELVRFYVAKCLIRCNKLELKFLD